MTPSQTKVLSALESGPKSNEELVRKTRMNYCTITKAVAHLVGIDRATKTKINGVDHYAFKPDNSIPMETTVQRAIRTRPVLHSIWQQA